MKVGGRHGRPLFGRVPLAAPSLLSPCGRPCRPPDGPRPCGAGSVAAARQSSRTSRRRLGERDRAAPSRCRAVARAWLPTMRSTSTGRRSAGSLHARAAARAACVRKMRDHLGDADALARAEVVDLAGPAALEQRHVARDDVAARRRSRAPGRRCPTRHHGLLLAALRCARSGARSTLHTNARAWPGPVWLNGRARTTSSPYAARPLRPPRRRPRPWSRRRSRPGGTAASSSIGSSRSPDVAVMRRTEPTTRTRRGASPCGARRRGARAVPPTLMRYARGRIVVGLGHERDRGEVDDGVRADRAQHALDLDARRLRRRVVVRGRPGGGHVASRTRP